MRMLMLMLMLMLNQTLQMVILTLLLLIRILPLLRMPMPTTSSPTHPEIYPTTASQSAATNPKADPSPPSNPITNASHCTFTRVSSPFSPSTLRIRIAPNNQVQVQVQVRVLVQEIEWGIIIVTPSGRGGVTASGSF